MTTTLSAGTVARRLGIAPSTLRSWHRRYGIGPGASAGHHRRYGERDVQVLALMLRLIRRGVAPAEAYRLAEPLTAAATTVERSGTAPARTGVARLVRAALRLDTLVLRETVAASLRRHGVADTWHRLVLPAITTVERRACDAAHQATARHVLHRAVAEAHAAVPRPPATTPIAVLTAALDATPLSDVYAAALAETGVACWSHGPVDDPELLRETIRQAHPTVTVLWAENGAAQRERALLAILTEAGAPVLIAAGTGWPAGAAVGVWPAPDLDTAVQLTTACVAAVTGP